MHQNQCDEEQTLIYLQQDYYPVQHLRVHEHFFVIIIIGIDQISSHKYQPYFIKLMKCSLLLHQHSWHSKYETITLHKKKTSHFFLLEF